MSLARPADKRRRLPGLARAQRRAVTQARARLLDNIGDLDPAIALGVLQTARSAGATEAIRTTAREALDAYFAPTLQVVEGPAPCPGGAA